MRVLHLGKYYPPAPGGIEAHVRTLARAQAGRGHQVSVLCVQHADGRGRPVGSRPLAVTRSSTDDDGPVVVRRLGRVAHLARLDIAPGLRGELARRFRSTDIVHLHVPNPLMLLACASLPIGPDLVITHHSDAVRQKRLAALLSPFEERVYSRARVVFSDSPGYADGSPRLEAHSRKVSVLPLGIDLEPYLNPSNGVLGQAEAIRRGHPGPLWLMVGRLVYYKGHSVALEALARVPGTLLVIGNGPLDVELRHAARTLGVCDEFHPTGPFEVGNYLLHVGSCAARKRVNDLLRIFAEVRKHCPGLRLIQAGGTFSPEQRSLLKSLGLVGDVEQRRGLTRNELARLYRGARVVLMPSDNEGFGLPVIEALACGVPVVASDLPTLREAGGGVARHVRVGDIHGFVQATLAAMEGHDPEAGLHHAARFTWSNHAAIIHEAYARLAAAL
jgi:glycosyltransferase involved in cell wall biosynthesis